jgi:TonB family protein
MRRLVSGIACTLACPALLSAHAPPPARAVTQAVDSLAQAFVAQRDAPSVAIAGVRGGEPIVMTLPAGVLAILASVSGSPRPPFPGGVGIVRADSVTFPALDSAEYARLRVRMRREYPRLMLDAGINGEVAVRFVVRADGTVDRATITVLRSSDNGDLFANASRRALGPLQFRPATRDGVAVPATLEATLNFSSNARQEATFSTGDGA